ncbi:hypothetical protein [Saccharicrinis sp. 156]|uniref:hypothetical protein n=1 Tax=Saccharicrinis sp. 156 TaxID=3417574 RepID=UPI003D332160
MLKDKKVSWTTISILGFAVWIFCGLLILFNAENELVYSLFDIIGTIGQLVGLGYILTNLKYRELLTDPIFMTGFSVGIIAIIMKIMHYQWNDFALMLSVVVLISGSLIRLAKKDRKEILNFLKVGWFISFSIGGVLKLNHYPGAYKTLAVSSFILWTIIVNYTYKLENRKNRCQQ